MTPGDAERAVRERTPVRAFYGTVGGHDMTHAVGTVIGYCDAPQVLIRTDDGRDVWWRADLTEETTAVERMPAPPPPPASYVQKWIVKGDQVVATWFEQVETP